MKTSTFLNAWVARYANDNAALIPEMWAMEALVLLQENMVMANLVHRDFENEIQEFGDVVNAHRPKRYRVARKTDSDNVTDQDAKAEKVQVKLNQHPHVSFVIKDGEMSKAFKDLVAFHLRPASEELGIYVDRVLLYEAYNFFENSVGRLGTAPTKSTLVQAKAQAEKQLMPRNRWMVITSGQEGDLLDTDAFTEADKVGDDGSALREGSLGRKYGFNIVHSQSSASISGAEVKNNSGAVNNASGYAAGSTSIAVDGVGEAITNGAWCTIAGDDTPQLITGSTGGATPSNITIWPGLKRKVVDDAKLTIYQHGLVNNGSGYSAGYEKHLTIDTVTAAPKTGQMVSQGVTSSANERYGVTPSIDGSTQTPTTTKILPNRPLESALSDDDVLGLGPDGEFGFAFNPDAMALVTRPLAQVEEGTGARSSVVNDPDAGISIRVTIAYDSKAQGHRVTVDLLLGVKTLNKDLGFLVYG